MTEQRPKGGVGVMILNNDAVLLAKRKGSHGEGEYAFPGGHLEHGESFEDCARREIREETCIEIDDIKFQYLANVKKYVDKHYAHIGLTAGRGFVTSIFKIFLIISYTCRVQLSLNFLLQIYFCLLKGDYPFKASKATTAKQ